MGKTKQQLHDELDLLVPSGTLKRSHIRIVGHALIELDLVTDLVCGYEHCNQSTREFTSPPAGQGTARHPMVVSLDHVVSLSDGGTDMPDNLQLLHFACNAGKGARDAWSADNPRAQVRRAAGAARMKQRMADEEYAKKMRERMTGMSLSEESRLKRSESMKKVWADPERKKKLSEGVKKSWETRRRNGT